MDWIKNNYDRFALLVLAVVLAASSGFLAWRLQQFPESFTAIQASSAHGSKIAALDTSAIDQARQALAKPAGWKDYPGSLLVSRKYIVKDGALVDTTTEGGMLHPPVPNEWFTKNNLDVLDGNVLNQDPDGDGFTNLDEFNAGTDPQDKSSHPAYVTKLVLKQFIKVPFRLKFAAYDGDSFQINTLDVRQPSQFLKIGEQIANTKFKLQKFDQKTVVVKSTGAEKDMSELTVQNIETNELVVLVLDQVVDSPDSYALFRFMWDNTEFRVKKDKVFALKPEPSVEYKLIDIGETEAVITTAKSGNTSIKVPHLQEQMK